MKYILLNEYKNYRPNMAVMQMKDDGSMKFALYCYSLMTCTFTSMTAYKAWLAAPAESPKDGEYDDWSVRSWVQLMPRRFKDTVVSGVLPEERIQGVFIFDTAQEMLDTIASNPRNLTPRTGKMLAWPSCAHYCFKREFLDPSLPEQRHFGGIHMKF